YLVATSDTGRSYSSSPQRAVALRKKLRLHRPDPIGEAGMLKIWGRTTSSNVQKVLWCCAELGLEYERVDLGGPFGGNQDPEYLAMNPNGRVPTINDDGLILWESNTICR